MHFFFFFFFFFFTLRFHDQVADHYGTYRHLALALWFSLIRYMFVLHCLSFKIWLDLPYCYPVFDLTHVIFSSISQTVL